MLQVIINYGVLLAFFLFTIDIILEIVRIYQTKCSDDISIKGSFIRALAAFIILAKYFSSKDIFLEVGQTIFVVFFVFYLVLMTHYRIQSGKRAEELCSPKI